MSTQDMIFALRDLTLRKTLGYIEILSTQCSPWLANEDFLLAQTHVQVVFPGGHSTMPIPTEPSDWSIFLF